MGQIHSPSPAQLVIAASSRYAAAVEWFRDRAEGEFGELALVSDAFNFTETDYYVACMGKDLQKQFFAFESLIDPGRLPETKRLTNRWESEYASLRLHTEPRPINLDPGYITLAKLVLASTKDHAHRLYMGDGIYAEVTLVYREKAWRVQPWTYPDYRRVDYQAFFSRCRQRLRRR